MANQKLTLVLFGSTSAVHFTPENVLLGEDRAVSGNVDVSQIVPVLRIVCGRGVSVINLLGLQESNLSQQTVDRIVTDLVDQNKIHVFIHVLCQLTDTDKVELDWLERTFGKAVFSHVMMLFTYKTQEKCDTIVDDLKRSPTLEQLLKRCRGRYHTCSKNFRNQSEMNMLLEKIDQMILENAKPCYTAEMYNTAVKIRTEESRKREQAFQSLQDEPPDIKHKVDKEGKVQVQESGVAEEGQGQRETSGKNIKQLFSRLGLGAHTLEVADVLKITATSLKCPEPCADKDLVHAFLQRLLIMDYNARYIPRERNFTENKTGPKHTQPKTLLDSIRKRQETVKSSTSEPFQIHPMDVQMATFHSSDHFLRQLMVTKLSQCQYAVPLIIPNPFTGEIELPLWTLRQIKKSWVSVDAAGKSISKCKPVCEVESPMVLFLRLGSPSSSKSELMNNLINKHQDTFFHRNCLQSSRTCLLMDGVVEIAWYCPSRASDWLKECTAFCNLHGDAGNHRSQCEILTEMATVNVVLLSTLEKDDNNDKIIEKLLSSSKPLIILLTDSDSAVEEVCTGKYTFGLKDRSQSDVAEELKTLIHECCINDSQSKSFKLENVAHLTNVIVDEGNEECQKAKGKANQTLSLLDKEELTSIKQEHLPCQGALWHDWCVKNKALYHLVGRPDNQITPIKQHMIKIRHQQHELGFSPLIKMFAEDLRALEEKERRFFLKWLGIALDSLTSDRVSALLRAYNKQWSIVSKKKRDKAQSLDEDQTKLEKISEDLNAVSFGLEHIIREMGQIYESFISTQSAGRTTEHDLEFYSLPQIAAEIMMSGYPLELLDGDAGHVPLIWVSAVLDELIKKLGDQRVFVLSVLGVQSSGKSTMLNAMFGLQFAVSAGRCTRGAFMQLVGVSEEMKKELKFDHILVVDTEGLRALELDGKTTTRHDNELATFVVGLGNLTLINIYGENPAEMQDVLQIVVQAFLRMKKVRLSPSCVFVHQNVGDVTAGDKNMEARRRLQEKLDAMTQLAAKEEESDAECFNGIIEFDTESNVKYFAHLWKGNPPMAPPNPSYSDNVHELRKNILTKASRNRGMTLSQFKISIRDLWSALLNENFVFSFKNTLEIMAYRKLEKMLYNQSKNLALSLKSKEISEDALRKNFEDIWSKCVKDLNQDSPSVADIDVWGDVMKFLMETYESGLFFERQNQALYDRIDTLGNYSEYIISKKKPEPGQRDLRPTESHVNEDDGGVLVEDEVCSPSEENSGFGFFSSEENKALRELTGSIIKGAEEEIKSKPIAEHGYSQIYIPEIITSIKEKVKAHQSQTSRYLLRKEFTVDLCLHVCSFAAERFGKLHDTFKEATDIMAYLEKQKLQYFRMFKNYCSGATSTTVFGEFMVDRLEPSILQAAYDKTALDVTEKMKRDVLAFRGNRSNLEKHILTLLAEQEDFENYKAYLHTPKEYFTKFITEVNKYLFEEKTTEVLEALKRNIKSVIKFVMDSVKKVTEDVTDKDGDVNMWLQLLSTELKDELQFKAESCPEQKEITDLNFLQEIINNHLPNIRSELCNRFLHGSDLKLEMFRKKPDQTMMEHLCRCCWAQCPFCSAICTNTLEDHSGDHDVRFHRNCGINGWSLMFSNTLGLECCTTAVSIDTLHFSTVDKVFKFKEYRKAGGEYAKWNICRDDSEMPYWKWFVCRFQKNLEDHYKKPFQEIPQEWKQYTKEKAIESLHDL